MLNPNIQVISEGVIPSEWATVNCYEGKEDTLERERRNLKRLEIVARVIEKLVSSI